MVVGVRYNRAERLVFHRVGKHGCHVARGRVEIALPAIEVQAMGVGEDRVVHAQLRRLGVHGVDKSLVGVIALRVDERSHRRCDRHGGVIARRHHKALERLGEGELVALFKVGGRLANGGRTLVYRYGVIRLGIFKRDDGRHDLGERGDLYLRVGIALKIGCSVLANNNRCSGNNIGLVFRRARLLSIGCAADDIRVADVRIGRWRRQRSRKRKGCGGGKGANEELTGAMRRLAVLEHGFHLKRM